MAGDDAFDFDLALSALGADGTDVQIMMRVLVDKLAGVLGEGLEVERGGGLMRRSNTLRRVQVRVGNDEFEARLAGAAPEFLVGQVSGGIRIHTARTGAQDWLRELLSALQVEATRSTRAREALEAILIGQG